MNYQPFENDSSSSESGSRTTATSSSSGSEDHLSLQYGNSADDGTYTSEHDRELEEVDFNSSHYKKNEKELELFEDEANNGNYEDEDYDDEDIRKPKRSKFLPFDFNALKTFDYKKALNDSKEALANFDWKVLKTKKNMLKILYCVLGFIAFVLIIDLPIAASKKRAKAKALADDQESTFDTPKPSLPIDAKVVSDAVFTYPPTIEATNAYTELYSGTIKPTAYWWQNQHENDGMFTQTVYPSGTLYPSVPWWPNPSGNKPWYQGSFQPTIWSSTFEPTEEKVEVELTDAEMEALLQADADYAEKDAEDAKKDAEDAEEAATKAEEEAKAAEEEAKKAEEDAKAAEEEAKAAEEAAKKAEEAAKVAEENLEVQQEREREATPQEPKKPIGFNLNRPTHTEAPVLAPTLEPTSEPTPVPVPTVSPTTSEPTTAAPLAWYIGWDGTWAPTLISETRTWAPTTVMPTLEEDKIEGISVETLGDGN